MKRKGITGALALFVTLMLIGTTVAPMVRADDVAIFPVKDRGSGEESLFVKLTLHDDGSVSIVPENSKTTMLKAVEIPESWKMMDSNEEKLVPSDQDWAYIKSILTDLSEKEQEILIYETQRIYEGTSDLSEKEQAEVLQQIGYSLIRATEGEGPLPKWYGSNGHWQMSTTAGTLLTYITTAHISTLGDYSYWADQNRLMQPPLPGLLENRHSWVLGEPGIPGLDNYGPASCEYFMNRARINFNQYNVEAAYIDIAKGLHYIEDMGCSFHTSAIYGQSHHSNYESWVSSHWSQLESAMQVDTYYIIGDPSDASEYLAWLSHQKLQPICDIMNTAGWENSPTLTQAITDHTRELIRETEMMTMGMIMYSAKFESPNTLGANRVPIVDYSTSYAYIDNVACSDNLYVYFYITHTYIGDLEIWLGWKEDSASTYTEWKIWDRQGGSTDNLALMLNPQGLQNIHDWRLRIKDSAGGDQGYLEEYVIQIG